MNNRLESLLATWLKDKDELDWILATVVETAGSSYRKAGAMMMINSLGQYYGLISGGCLESDLMRQARQCLDSGQNKLVCYDMREEDDLGWQLGIGCGGMVKILLQPILPSNQYLQLDKLKKQLDNRKACQYVQQLDTTTPINFVTDQNGELQTPSSDKIIHSIQPTPLLGIFGGGVDAQPLCQMASQLGWQVVVFDERVNYAREQYFANATAIVKQPIESAIDNQWFNQLNAIAIMTHNVELDGKALSVSQASCAEFIGLLGPSHRTDKVLKSANLSRPNLIKPLSNPIGLDIGGELPESIALSILAEIHGVLENKMSLTQPVQLQHVG